MSADRAQQPALPTWRQAVSDPFFVPLLLCAASGVELARVVFRRVAFPFDLLVWSESAFMTNMLKLGAGAPIYGPPALANSFVYPPGMELLCYALLHPLGRDLDVSWCRAVSVAIGMAAAFFAASAAVRLAGRESTPVARCLAALVAWLVLSQNFTSDVLHPDNLHMAHATACLALSLRVVQERSQRAAIAAAALAGFGVLTKQTEAATVLGVIAVAALTFSVRSPIFWRTCGVAIGTNALSLGWLFSTANARFQLIEVLGRHYIDWHRASELTGQATERHRPILIGLAILGIVRVIRGGGARSVLAWAILGVTCALPSVASYLKIMGAWNNFGIVEVWLFIPAWAAIAGLPRSRLARFGTIAAFACSAWVLRTIKNAPSEEYTRHFRSIEARVGADLGGGKRVLVGHGTSMLIHLGVREPPVDREISILELVTAGLAERTATAQRFEAGAYDRLYVVTAWTSPEIQAARDARYERREVIDPLPELGWHWGNGLYQAFGHQEVWDRR